MYVWMHVCIRVRMYVHVCVCARTFVYAYRFVCLYVHNGTCMYRSVFRKTDMNEHMDLGTFDMMRYAHADLLPSL